MNKALTLIALAASSVAVLGEYTPEALADQIKALPGAEALTFNFNQFSGYVKINGTKNMHYWLVESQNNPATDPIAFWTNGGPGCKIFVCDATRHCLKILHFAFYFQALDCSDF